MSGSIKTPTKAAAGLGSAKAGVEHFITQRVSALALAVLVPWFLIALVTGYSGGFEGASAFVSAPVNTVLLILGLSAAFYHMRLGMQVVVEDYIGNHGTRAALLILNTFVTAALWVTSVVAVLRISLGA